MFRRSLMINFTFSMISTAVVMATMPSFRSVLTGMRTSFLTYSQDNALLSPIVHRTLSLR